ncbi:MAG: diguanylate cyclase [Rhodoferax sp.]|uniref:sensor domain-containing diguanylate cyclase n=1 Tax=Rhodoferax sp. TaxID=50421 RepID=UPI00271B6217|nr:sensor domain-containing diguanylate cyclase [Rhodoferax sp.]MDO8447231.1 diguanylate cyclase [Rhodoferax sp.]
MTQNTKKPVHWAVRLNHQNRSGSFVLLFTAIGAHMVSQGYSLLAWGLLTLQFLVYPHLMYWRARGARDAMQAELNNLVIDSLLFGIWAAALAFPVWITFTLVIGTTITHVLYLGLRGVWRSVAALAGGALATVTIAGLRLSPHTDGLTTLLCVVALLLYLLAFAHLAYLRTRMLRDTREKLRLREQTLHAANEALQRQFAEIHALQAQLSEQANRDPLTGLYNRRYLDPTLARELARCEREGQPLSLMLIDLDHFKQVNDSYGHPAGDEVLKNLAAMLNEQARAADVVCRYGGEEFLLVLPNMPAHIALVRADQWRAAFAATTVRFDKFQMQTTLSIGIATYPGHGASAEELIRHADRALYRAKSEGRDRVMLFQTETVVAIT